MDSTRNQQFVSYLAKLFFILANLLPLYGVWFWNWDAKQIFLVYCMESIIVGLMTIGRMTLTGLFGPRTSQTSAKGDFSWVGLVLFFIVHYGFFLAIQMGIFFGVSNMIPRARGPFETIQAIPSVMSLQSWIMLLALWAAYMMDLVMNFMIPKKFHETNIYMEMFRPYPRVVVQQFVVIIGSFFLLFGAAKVFIAVFIVVKLWVEQSKFMLNQFGKAIEQMKQSQKF